MVNGAGLVMDYTGVDLCTFGNVLRFLPPLSTTDDLLTEALDVLADAFAAL